MNSNILISIIIPVYNIENKYLQRVYESITQISKLKYEIIFVNDGSSDNSLEKLYELFDNNKDVKIITQENQGLSGARNTGIKKATGDYLIFVDADDTINADNLNSLLSKITKENIDILGFKVQFIDEQNVPLGKMDCHNVTINKIQNGPKFLIEGFQPSSACQFIYKREFILNNNLFFYPKIYHEDVEFTTRLMVKANNAKILFTDVIVYNYTQISGSMSKPKSEEKIHKLLYDEFLVAELIKANLSENNSKELNVAIQKNYNSIVWNLLWRFYRKPNEVDKEFKQKCITDLKKNGLYPIKGKLKTPFQNITRLLMNNSFIIEKFIIK